MQKFKFYYYVIIGDERGNHLELRLNTAQFNALNISFFLDLGFIVTVREIRELLEDEK